MNKNLLKIVIFGGVFVIAALLALLLSGNKKEEVSYMALGDARLPVITLCAEDTDINMLYGHTGETDAASAQETLTPLGADYKLPIKIYAFDAAVTSISYEVRSIDGSNLIEETSLDNWTNGEEYISAQLPIKDIIEEGREYSLLIKLSTEDFSDISYYTRIIRSDGLKTAEMLEYISGFHAATFDEKAAAEYAVNWEVDGSGDDESLAFTDIHSKFANLTYADLDPTQITDTVINILEMDETFGSFKLSFMLENEFEDGTVSTYYADEFFCAQWSELRFYLMSYEREMTEIFDVSDTSVSSRGLEFGIASKDDVALSASPSETYTAFTYNGELWLYSASNKEINRVFSFADGQENLYKLNRNYGTKVVNADDEGNVSFIAYGYMSRGEHEGEMGLSYYKYDHETGTLNEIIYISSDQSFEAMSFDLEKLCVSHGDLLYFLFDDTVYALDESGPEVVRVLEGAQSHNLKVNDLQDIIAFSLGDDLKLPSQIQVSYLNAQKNIIINAAEGEYTLPQGFIDEDFISTTGRTKDVTAVGFDNIYPQYSLSITDSTNTEISHYEKSGVMISGVTVADEKITLERMQKKDGKYVVIDKDVLMQNDRKEKEKTIEVLKNEVAEIKGRIYYYEIEDAAKASQCERISPEKISYYEGKMSSTNDTESDIYYAYAHGKLVGAYEEAGDAIIAAYDGMGYVTDGDGYRIWHRKGKSTVKVSVSFDPEPFKQGETVYQALNGITDGKIVNLSGCSIKQILIFLENGAPVIALDTENKPYFITGYDTFNIYIYDIDTGKTTKMGQEDAQEFFEEAGLKMLSYVEK